MLKFQELCKQYQTGYFQRPVAHVKHNTEKLVQVKTLPYMECVLCVRAHVCVYVCVCVVCVCIHVMFAYVYACVVCAAIICSFIQLNYQ